LLPINVKYLNALMQLFSLMGRHQFHALISQ